MKIKSRFKDYYDYVAHAYGGGDERVTYVREPLKDEVTVALHKNHGLSDPYLDTTRTKIKYLAINGKYYVLLSVADDSGVYSKYELFTEKNFGHRLDGIITRYRGWTGAKAKNMRWEHYFDCESDTIVMISQQIAQPVFIIDSVSWDSKRREYSYLIDRTIPLLQEYGINHYIQPEQMYQETAYYISNKMVTSPDLVVVDNMSDKEKIAQHGFDLKQSFRHRK